MKTAKARIIHAEPPPGDHPLAIAAGVSLDTRCPSVPGASLGNIPMCLILLALHQHPEFPLLIAANRDERFERPTQPLAPWPEAPQVLAGRDLQAGGSWFGITRDGRFAAVTNVREWPPQTGWPRSRGSLVSDFLLGSMSAADYARSCAIHNDQFAGYNLLVGHLPGGNPSGNDSAELWYCSNRGHEPLRQLQPGLYGLSNGALGDQWPKTRTGSAALRALLLREPTPEGLLALLGDRSIPADSALPDTGVGLEKERMLAPCFIAGDDYGTRASTALLVDRHGVATVWEQNFAAGGEPTALQRYEWPLERIC